MPIDNPDALCNTYMDVDPNFMLILEIKSAYLSSDNIKDDIIAKSASGDEIDLNLKFKNESNKSLVEVTATDGYKRGYAYTLSIEKNDSLIFLDRDESIRKVIFTVQADDSDTLDIKKNYPTYDLSKVSHFEGFVDDAYLIYEGNLSQTADDIIMFKKDNESLFVKVVKTESINGGVKVYYKAPDVDEIFNELDLHIDHKEANVEEDFVLNDITRIANELANSDQVLMYCYAIADEYDFIPQLGGFIDSGTINFSFKPEGNKFTLSFEISYTHTTQSGWRICGSLKFKWVKSFVVSADASIHTVLGIPVGISMNASVGCDDSFVFQPTITKKNKAFDPGNVDDSPKDLDLSKAKKAVEKYKERWTELDKSGYKKDVVTGDTVMINLGRLSIYLGYIEVDIDVYACLKLTTDITLGVSYVYNYHTVLIDYGTDSNTGDAGISASNVGVHTISAYLAGKMSIEAYLKLKVTVSITGLRALANIAVDGDAGFYLDFTGLGTAGYDFNNMTFDGNLGACLEFGFFFRVTLNVNLLYFIHLNWELLGGRAPLFKLGAALDIKDRVYNDTIELTKLETDLQETPTFTFTVFDGEGLSLINKTYKYDSKVTYFESFLSKNAEHEIFTNFNIEGTDKAKFRNGKIIIDEGVAELNFKLTFNVERSPFQSPEKLEVNFHFKSKDAKQVTFDNLDSRYYLPGQKIDFPKVVEERNGFLFKGYLYNGEIYDERSVVTVDSENINFESIYVENRFYTVNFYDGFNNLICTKEVRNYDDVIPPTELERDLNMDGFTFICYDKSLKQITSDLDIYAIYERSAS